MTLSFLCLLLAPRQIILRTAAISLIVAAAASGGGGSGSTEGGETYEEPSLSHVPNKARGSMDYVLLCDFL